MSVEEHNTPPGQPLPGVHNPPPAQSLDTHGPPLHGVAPCAPCPGERSEGQRLRNPRACGDPQPAWRADHPLSDTAHTGPPLGELTHAQGQTLRNPLASDHGRPDWASRTP